ncbi:MAG: hypothetical protein HND55_06190 [Pseudomonadota bacterium]|nr:MAG: hypothetical protein HND55_06190 [Pseudomonadota bacterium]
MLQAIRERVTGIVAIFVLGLLAVPFLFFGLESYMQAVPQDAVAVVGDEEISTSEFQTSFARYRAQLRQRLGDQYNDVAANQPAARREHLESMIDQLLLRQHARDLGMRISDRAIADILADIEAFQIDGQFNADAYRQALGAIGETPRSFELDLRDDLLTQLLPMALTDTAIVTETEVDRLISLQQQKRSATLVEVSAEPFRSEIEIGQEDIAEYYQGHLDSFTSEERVRLGYVSLQADELLEDATLGEEELRQRYEAARQRYLTPEARRASHILLAAGDERSAEEARALADALRERVREGESFADLAAEYSDDFVSAEDGGALGWIEPDDMVEPFEDALYALEEPGAISEPVETRFGWHLIRLEEIRPPQGMSFEEARPEILQEYLERQRDELFIEMSERMVDLVYADDTSLEPLAEALGLEIRETDWLTRAGHEQGVASHMEVVEAAFSDLVLLDGAVSDPIDIDRNHMVAIKVIEHEPAEPRPLEEVSDSIRERLLAERASQAAKAQAETLLERLSAGEFEGLEALAEAESLELIELDAVGRNAFEHGPQFIQALFRLPDPGEAPTLHVLEKQDGYALVRLEAVQPGNPAEASDSERDLVRRQIQFGRATYERTGLLDWLRDNTEISVIEDRL